jgi:ribosomal protein S9
MFIGLDNNAILKDAGTPQKAASRRQEILQELVMEPGIAFTMTSDKNNQMKIQAEMTTGQFEAVSEAITKSIVEKQRALEDPSPRVR